MENFWINNKRGYSVSNKRNNILYSHWNLKLLTTLHFGTNLQESFKMFPLNERYIMLLIGGFDKFVHVYTIDSQSTSEDTVEYHTSLMGHSDSIRDYWVTQAHENDLRYIFSCSQDWLINPKARYNNLHIDHLNLNKEIY